MKLITIATYDNAVEAHAVRNQLIDNGIDSTVINDVAVNALWHIGSALGGIKLQVADSDLQVARKVLDLDGKAGGTGTSWRCRDCNEVIEPGFDSCWSCGEARATVDDPAFQPGSAEDSSVNGGDDPTREDIAARQEAAAAGLKVATEATEELVTRAWRAAIIGLFVLPGLLHCYSVWLLLRVGMTGESLSAAGARRFIAAIAVDLFAIAVAAALVSWMIWSS